MAEEKKVLEALESDIMNADIPDSEKNKIMKNFLKLKEQKINLMITGATGCGKSSTINALFNAEKAMYRVAVSSFADKASAAKARDAFKAKYPNRSDFQGAWLLYRIN